MCKIRKFLRNSMKLEKNTLSTCLGKRWSVVLLLKDLIINMESYMQYTPTFHPFQPSRKKKHYENTVTNTISGYLHENMYI